MPRHRKAASCSGPRRRSPASRPGTKSPQIKIPVTWTANPNPSATPVSLELTAPPGITGTFTPTRPTAANRSSSSKPKNRSEPGKYTVHGRRLRRQRRTVRKALERPDPGRNHRTVHRQPARRLPGLPLHSGRGRDPDRHRPAELSDPIQVDAYLNPASTAKFVATSAGSVDRLPPRQRDAQPERRRSEDVGDGRDGPRRRRRNGRITVVAAPSGYAHRGSPPGPSRWSRATSTRSHRAAGSTPQRGIPGTLMTVNGAGFCPGDKVAIGPNEDTANPESVATPGKTLTFRVPRAAVTGPLRILPLKGDSVQRPGDPDHELPQQPRPSAGRTTTTECA